MPVRVFIFHKNMSSKNHFFPLHTSSTQSAGAIVYTDCISAEG